MSEDKSKFDLKVEKFFDECRAESNEQGIALVVGKKESGNVGSGMFGDTEDVADIVIEILSRGKWVAATVLDKLVKYGSPELLKHIVDKIFSERGDALGESMVMKISTDTPAEEVSELINAKLQELNDEKRKEKGKA